MSGSNKSASQSSSFFIPYEQSAKSHPESSSSLQGHSSEAIATKLHPKKIKNVFAQQYEQAMAKLNAKKQNNKLFDITFSFADPSCIIAICRRHPYFWEPTTSTPITDSIFIDLIVNIRVFQVQEFRCSLAVHSIFDAIISIRTLGFSYIALFVQWIFC